MSREPFFDGFSGALIQIMRNRDFGSLAHLFRRSKVGPAQRVARLSIVEGQMQVSLMLHGDRDLEGLESARDLNRLPGLDFLRAVSLHLRHMKLKVCLILRVKPVAAFDGDRVSLLQMRGGRSNFLDLDEVAVPESLRPEVNGNGFLNGLAQCGGA
jgi:hypothetical protein